MRWLLTLLAGLSMVLGVAAVAQNDDQLKQQYRAAYHALEVHDDAAVLAVLDGGFPVNYQDDDGYTLLHTAASNNRLDMVKELLRRGANPGIKSNMGFTPVDSGITMPKIVDLLVAAGGPRPVGYRAPAPASRPAASTAKAAGKSSPAASAAPKSRFARQCEDKWYADQALCSDSTCKMRAYRKWQTCLKTGSYY